MENLSKTISWKLSVISENYKTIRSFSNSITTKREKQLIEDIQRRAYSVLSLNNLNYTFIDETLNCQFFIIRKKNLHKI